MHMTTGMATSRTTRTTRTKTMRGRGGEEGEDYGRDLRVFERLPRGSFWALFGLQNSSVGGNPES